MKFFKLIIAALALSLAATSPAFAQQKGRGMPTPEQQIERLEQAVGSLTDAQKEKIKAIYAKTREEMQKVPEDQRREKMGEMMRKQREDVMKVLTPEQQEKYKAMAQKGGERGGGRKKNN